MQNPSLTLRGPLGQWEHLLGSWSHANTWGFLEGSKDVAVYRLWIMANLGFRLASRGQKHLGAHGAERSKVAGAAATKPQVQEDWVSLVIVQMAKQSLHKVCRNEGISQ